MESKLLLAWNNKYAQLSAFETWLLIENEKPTVPEQLPIVLQVILSQTHRKRALTLIAKFLERGDWAVDLVLSVGIFPYILKLLQSSSAELRKVRRLVRSNCASNCSKGTSILVGQNNLPRSFMRCRFGERERPCLSVGLSR